MNILCLFTGSHHLNDLISKQQIIMSSRSEAPRIWVFKIVCGSRNHTRSSERCSGARTFLVVGALCVVPGLFHFFFACFVYWPCFAFPFAFRFADNCAIYNTYCLLAYLPYVSHLGQDSPWDYSLVFSLFLFEVNRGVSHYRILSISRDVGWPVQQNFLWLSLGRNQYRREGL